MFLHTWITRESWHFKLTATLRLRVCIHGYLSLISWCSISFRFTGTTKGRFRNKLLAVVRVCSLDVVNFYRRLWKKKALVTIIISLKRKVQSFSRVTIPPRGGHLLGIYQVVYSWDRNSAAGVFFLSPSLFFLRLVRLLRFSHLVKNRHKWFLGMMSTKIPLWSSVMPSILWETLHFVSKELRAFRESSVATKWRKQAIAGIMCM